MRGKAVARCRRRESVTRGEPRETGRDHASRRRGDRRAVPDIVIVCVAAPQSGGRVWVIRVILVVGRLLPVFPWKRTSSGPVAMSQRCQFRTHAPQQIRPRAGLALKRVAIRLKSPCCQLRNSRRASNPPPSRLASVSVPRSALASCWAMARPSPVPPVSRLREASTR